MVDTLTLVNPIFVILEGCGPLVSYQVPTRVILFTSVASVRLAKEGIFQIMVNIVEGLRLCTLIKTVDGTRLAQPSIRGIASN